MIDVAKYFRSALAAQVNKRINFKDNSFEICKYDDIRSGKLSNDVFNALLGKPIPDNQDEMDFIEESLEEALSSINVIIAYKTVKTLIDGQEKINNDIEELTGVFFVPAVLKSNNTLLFDLAKLPWIPRDFLKPMYEPSLTICSQYDFDEQLSKMIGQKNKISKWADYIQYADDLFSNALKFNEDGLSLEFEENLYIFKDDSVSAIMHLMPLYDKIINGETKNKLFARFTNRIPEVTRPLISNNKSAFIKHYGQMNGEYPLSPSQRECVTHFSELEDGNILAVSGPPGTGKTTLLQSIVTNTIVTRALNRQDAPIIVGTSTNNQAVTNIIDSFGKIDAIGIKNIESRWVCNVSSFALYLPSKAKMKVAREKGYQFDNGKGEYFNQMIESEQNKHDSEQKFISEFNRFFELQEKSISKCVTIIHSELVSINKLKDQYLDLYEEADSANVNLACINSELTLVENEIHRLTEKLERLRFRMGEWISFYSKLPWWIKLFKFIGFVKARLCSRINQFILINETFLNKEMAIGEIEEIYSDQIDHQKHKIHEGNSRKQVLLNIISKRNHLEQESIKALNSVNKNNSDAMLNLSFVEESIENANASLDKSLRYYMFWLATHYYEARWLLDENPLTEKQNKSNFPDVVKRKYLRKAMLTPCFVTTLYMLPNLYWGYSGDKNDKMKYLEDFIDLLIVDEAGQVLPEVSACSFVLAKKALVVGDEKQIAPVYSVSAALDKALTNEAGLDTSESFVVHDYLNSSDSSLMKIASNQCAYEKYGNKGLFLSEHRRCYDEIIQYCNDLMYGGHLQPMRGSAYKNGDYIYKMISPMKHLHVDTAQSEKKGNSRYNSNEAEYISKWIAENFKDITTQNSSVDPKQLLAIITPFKAQVNAIKQALNRNLPYDISSKIEVGTVHAFQGAERSIIIFSTVYGSQDGGCYFIDANDSLMNVAVSRSKDAFIVCGDFNCLSNDLKKPSGLLKKYFSSNVT